MKTKSSLATIRMVFLSAAAVLIASACTTLNDSPSTPDDITSIPSVTSKESLPTPSTTPTSEVSDCPNPLDENALNQLVFSLGALSGIHELQPGDTVDLSVGIVECCVIFETVPACVAWSVEPESAGSIDPKTGELQVNPRTENGTILSVTANIEDDKYILTQEILVYTLEDNPHVGYWREIAQLSCENGSEIIPEASIGELLFQANGTFSVTWAPFEVYRDYWGTYTFNQQTGALELVIESGNHIPANVDLNGQLQVDENGRLLLENIWLGEPAYEQLTPTCGHIFE